MKRINILALAILAIFSLTANAQFIPASDDYSVNKAAAHVIPVRESSSFCFVLNHDTVKALREANVIVGSSRSKIKIDCLEVVTQLPIAESKDEKVSHYFIKTHDVSKFCRQISDKWTLDRTNNAIYETCLVSITSKEVVTIYE